MRLVARSPPISSRSQLGFMRPGLRGQINREFGTVLGEGTSQIQLRRRSGFGGMKDRLGRSLKRTLTIPVVSKPSQYIELIEQKMPERVRSEILAMYNSTCGAIITDPALMGVPIDDHGFHRGHAVFDTCNIHNGNAYGIDMHLERLLSSAEMARIEVKFSHAQLRDILLETMAAAGRPDGVFCRYWLTAGRGDFQISPRGCLEGSSFYTIVHKTWDRDDTTAVKEVIVTTPVKPPLLANMKSNNYMINALSSMEAEDYGGSLGIQADVNGYILEGSISCVAIVGEDRILRTPKFDLILPSLTVKRILDLGHKLLDSGIISGIFQNDVHIDDVLQAKEVIMLGGHHVVPVGRVGDTVIGNGERGPVCRGLQKLQYEDMLDAKMLTPIPFRSN